MLKYNYSISVSSNAQDIVLENMYVSPDLTFISGTTKANMVCAVGDKVWIRTPYFPSDLKSVVTGVELVKRNGYMFVPKTLQVQHAKTYMTNNTSVVVSYVEYNGNTYFANINDGTFLINEERYNPVNSFLTINEKVYIDNDKVIVDGVTYNVFINQQGDPYFTDSAGNVYIQPNTWDTNFVTYNSELITKITIGENYKKSIDCRRISYYGYRPYIVYGGEKLYLQYFYDGNNNVTGAGVKIDNVEYPCDALYSIHDYDFNQGYNLYNIKDFLKNEVGNAVMAVNGSEYIIHFEPDEIEGCGIIGIETVLEQLPILIGDRLTVHTIDTSTEVRVKYDEDNNAFVYVNGRRYNSVRNLCDTLDWGNINYPIIYEGDCENIGIGSIAHIVTNDGNNIYFKVKEVSSEKAKKLRRVENVNGTWKELYSMTGYDGLVVYSNKVNYDVNNADGFRIGDYNARIYSKTIKWNEGTEIETEESYDYIVLGSNLEYRLKVIDTVGSNRILCVPDVDITIYDTMSKDELVTEILSSIQGNTFVVERRNNTFGVTDLYYDTWMGEAVQNGESISTYELADVVNNIQIIKKASHFTIPVGLSKNVSNRLEYNDLITNLYYAEEGENAVNALIDMEKDMYSPVYLNNNSELTSVDKIVFNLHFRTRDLETWKIIEDTGEYYDGSTEQNLNANFQYCNWFITDYYPYNQFKNFGGKDYNFNNVVDKSDLLGLLYFTTSDVKDKREKLKRSFLRLTFFDSKNPEKQNMLGTSTIYFDCDRYLTILNSSHPGVHYEQVYQTQNPNRTKDNDTDDKMYDEENTPTVLTESFNMVNTSIFTNSNNMVFDDIVLDSRMYVEGRYTANNSSEGFYTYIIKAFANKKKKQTIYMKAEFFHAGIGIKIPMILPTSPNNEAIGRRCWTDSVLKDFKEGYDIKTVFDKLYIPIDIEYSKDLHKFVYSVSADNNFLNAVKEGDNWIFNLFELKIKP